MGTDTVITAAGATVTDTTSSAEILEKGETTYSTAAVSPIMLTAGKLSNLTLNEVDDTFGSKGTVDEERWRVVGDFGEQSSTAEHGWEEPLLAADSSGSKSSAKDISDVPFEGMVTCNPRMTHHIITHCLCILRICYVVYTSDWTTSTYQVVNTSGRSGSAFRSPFTQPPPPPPWAVSLERSEY